MSVRRKYKVTTTITQYMWAASRSDAEQFQQELFQKGKLDVINNGVTEVKYCFTGGKDFIDAPDDISKSRDPMSEPRRGDWLEIQHGDLSACALVRRLTRRKVYYYEALSGSERSVDRDRWTVWAGQHTIHPAYDGIVPPFIVDEAIEAHEQRGMLKGFNATPDSSLILEILDKYGYVPDDYEIENGYWAELYIDRAISDRILADQAAPESMASGAGLDQDLGDFAIGFSEELPTLDEF